MANYTEVTRPASEIHAMHDEIMRLRAENAEQAAILNEVRDSRDNFQHACARHVATIAALTAALNWLSTTFGEGLRSGLFTTAMVSAARAALAKLGESQS